MPAACRARGDGAAPRFRAGDGVASFTCDCAIGREAGSSGEDDSAPYAKMLAWFAAGAVRSRYFSPSYSSKLPK
jgi:hypothetical protein